MGGNIAWTIRKEDGTEYRMNRWTNIFPSIAMNDPFLTGDTVAFDEALKSWLDMKADWEENRKTKNFKLNMTPVYAPYPAMLAPSEYGFIITDFKNKAIVSCNTYTSLDGEYIYDPNVLKGGSTIKGEPAAEYEARIRKIFEDKRAVWVDGLGSRYPVEDQTFEDVRANVVASKRHFHILHVKPLAPWHLFDYGDSNASRIMAYEKVKELGFVLSAAEEKRFASWIKD